MKNSIILILASITLSFTACSVDSVENDAEKLVKVACEGERTTDMERKKELRKEYGKLNREMKIKYKDRIEDNVRLTGLYFSKLKDCLGYIPVR